MNRAQKRALAKKSRRGEITERDIQRYAQIEADNMRAEEAQKAAENSVETLMTAFALYLHEELGFGQKRLMRALQNIDDWAGRINNGDESVAESIQRLEDEAAVVIKCRGGGEDAEVSSDG